MKSATDAPSIASLYSVCIQSFDRLCDLLQQLNCEFSCQISLLALQDELGRFRVWAGNVGAHRSGRVSLDHRLREASQMHKKVSELLMDLNGSLKEVIAIVSHERQPFDELVWSSDSSVSSLEDGSTGELEDKANHTTELQERFLEITHVITCLYKFSIAIRNPAPRDRLQKCASIDVSHYNFFDIQHTSHKFPKAGKYLIDRLGRANSRRRQLFKYYKNHHHKLTRYIDILQPEGAPVDQQPKKPEIADSGEETPERAEKDYSLHRRRSNVGKGPSTIATTVNTQTTISTYVQGPSDTIEVCSDSGQSQTSYTTSVSGDTRCKLRVPPPPKPDITLEGSPFECPYCFSIKIVHGSHSWMKHVFKDLQPYVCTFKDCPKPDRLFDTRHDWYNHEVEVHRREWFCNACQIPFHTKLLFEDHLKQDHCGLFTETQIPALIDGCERVINSEQTCPLCEEMYPPPQLQSHLARHMQQLALFTLPKMLEETDDDEGSIGVQASGLEENTEESDHTGLDMASNLSEEIGVTDPHNEGSKPSECPICLELIDSPLIIGSCGHGFCSKCLTRIQNQRVGSNPQQSKEDNDGARCPKCHSELSMDQAIDTQTFRKVPDTRDETWQYLTTAKDLGYEELMPGFSRRVSADILDRAASADLEKVVEEMKKSLGPEHPDTLANMANLGLVYASQRRWGDAMDPQAEVVDARIKNLGKEHPDTLKAMVRLASTYYSDGTPGADELYGDVVEIGGKILGKEHPDILEAMAGLASTYSNDKLFDKAEKLLVQVVTTREKSLGKEHPDTIDAMDSLAVTYMDLGRFDEAEKLQVHVLHTREKVLGKEHCKTLEVMADLSSTYWNQKRFKEAEELEVQVVAIREKFLGKENYYTVQAMENLALTYVDQGRLHEAEKLQVQVIAIREKVSPKEGGDPLDAMAQLASTYVKMGRLGEAEELQTHVLATRESTLHKEHPEILDAMKALASTYRAQGHLDRERELLTELEERKKLDVKDSD